MKQEVWFVIADTLYEGSDMVMSVHATEKSAEAESERLEAASVKAEEREARWLDKLGRGDPGRQPKWPADVPRGCDFTVSGPWEVRP